MYIFNLVYSWLGRHGRDAPPSANSHVTSHQRKIHKRTSRNAPDLILARATGLVGSPVLSRKPVTVTMTHNTQSPHINIIIIHRDFERYDALAAARSSASLSASRLFVSPAEHLGCFMTHTAVGSLDDKLQGAGVFKPSPS
ncbi:hypothetical protein MANI_007364 [Metarhizium anisopliae]